MFKRLAASAAIVGVLGVGAVMAAGVTAPVANANGCFGWNGIFIHANWCDNGFGYGNGYGNGWQQPGFFPPQQPIFYPQQPGYPPPQQCGCGY